MNKPVLSQLARLVLQALICITWVSTYAQEVCERSGVEFGFFNGVQTTDLKANDVAEYFLPRQYGRTTPNGEPITYALYYNDTEGFSDFVETFDQRLQEHNGLLAGRFELFFSAMKGEGSWWDALTGAVPALKGLLAGLADTFRATLIRDLTADFGRPETFAVAQRHREQIAHAVAMEKKLLLFAHSQGNLFVNKAYDHAVGLSDTKSVRVVHVAPASPRATGPHSLADLDLVINGLRLVGSVLPVSDSMPGYALRPPGLNGKRDALGHGLLEIYLNPSLPMAAQIHGHVLKALRELESPPKKPWADYPEFVPNPWKGGERPEALFEAVPPSHSLDQIVSTASVPAIWKLERLVFSTGSSIEYWAGGYREPAESGWSRTTYSGRNVAGSLECTWAPAASSGGDRARSECRMEHVPMGYWSNSIPDEILALGGAEPGTVVSLYTMTYTNYNREFALFGLRENYYVFPPEKTWVSFLYHAWGGVVSSKYEIRKELFARSMANLVNGEAIARWQEARTAHDSAEQIRFNRYLQFRDEYEQRRKRCEVILPPPPAPPGPIPEVCNPAEGDLCVT